MTWNILGFEAKTSLNKILDEVVSSFCIKL